MIGVLIKGGNVDIDTYIRGKSFANKGSDQGDDSISQATPKIASKPAEAKREE